MKFLNFEFHRLDLRRGGGLRGMRNRALIGCMSHKGGCDSAISKAVMPRLHKSDRLSYVASGFSSQAITYVHKYHPQFNIGATLTNRCLTSGAIQYGVPMNVFLRPMVLSSWALTPKSTNLTSALSVNKTFWPLISRWITLQACKCVNPFSTSL